MTIINISMYEIRRLEMFGMTFGGVGFARSQRNSKVEPGHSARYVRRACIVDKVGCPVAELSDTGA